LAGAAGAAVVLRDERRSCLVGEDTAVGWSGARFSADDRLLARENGGESTKKGVPDRGRQMRAAENEMVIE
jgi:hypothetical protein